MWVIALPDGFAARVRTSDLEADAAAPTAEDLAPFGEYGRLIDRRPRVALRKNLALPRRFSCSLDYRQVVRGITDDLSF